MYGNTGIEPAVRNYFGTPSAATDTTGSGGMPTADPLKLFGAMGIGGGIGSALAGLFGGGQTPMGAASPYFQQALQQMYGLQRGLPGYYAPYMGAGESALPELERGYGEMAGDPTALMSKIGQTFQASPGYAFQKQQALEAADRAAAAGGMVGSPAEQAELAKTVTGFANQDYYNYLSRALQQHQLGLTGLQNLAGLGFGAAGALGRGEMGIGANIANILGSQGELAAAQAKAEQQRRADIFGGLGEVAGGALMFL